jgi:hypothetical protein
VGYRLIGFHLAESLSGRGSLFLIGCQSVTDALQLKINGF